MNQQLHRTIATEPVSTEPSRTADRQPATRRIAGRLWSSLGFGWRKRRGLGVHLGDDAIRLAAVDVRERRLLAIAERPLDLGDIVDGEIRRPETVRRLLLELLREFGVPRRGSFSLAVEADLDPVARLPPPGCTSTNVVTQSGREVGEAFVRTEMLEWLSAVVVEMSPTARIEPVATAVLRCFDDRVHIDGTTHITHTSGGRQTQIVVDVVSYEGSRRPVSIQANTTAGRGGGTGIASGPASTPQPCEPNVELGPGLTTTIGDRVDAFAPAIGAALAQTGAVACDFRSGSVMTRPADESTSPAWVLQRI